jgi:hypothetical protein
VIDMSQEAETDQPCLGTQEERGYQYPMAGRGREGHAALRGQPRTFPEHQCVLGSCQAIGASLGRDQKKAECKGEAKTQSLCVSVWYCAL